MSLNWISAHSYLPDLDREREERILRNALKGSSESSKVVARLAGILIDRKKPDEALDLVKNAYQERPTDGIIQYALAETLRKTGDFENALTHYLKLGETNDQTPITKAYIAQCYAETGLTDQAWSILEELLLAPAPSFAVFDVISSSLWSMKAYDHIISFCQFNAEHLGYHTWFESNSRRALLRKHDGVTAPFESLFDYDRLVTTIDLNAVKGGDWNQQLKSGLNKYIADYQSHKMSVGEGTEGTINGWKVNFGDDHNPFVKPLLDEVKLQMSTYYERNRISQHRDFSNSLDVQMSAWYIVFKKEGFLKPHIHPMGILSGVYYLSIPESVKNSTEPSPGWLRFGYDKSEFPNTPEKYVKPQEGKLLLFPSYVSHHTIPMETDEERICFSFDAKRVDRAPGFS